MEFKITKTEAKTNKDQYKEIVSHLKEEKEIVWKYKVFENNQKLSVIFEGSIGTNRKKIVLSYVPEFVLKKYKKSEPISILSKKETTSDPDDGELLVNWKDIEGGSLCFHHGKGVKKEEAMMLCVYFDKDRFDIISGVLNPCLIKQLELLGYDLKTLHFSIKKKI